MPLSRAEEGEGWNGGEVAESMTETRSGRANREQFCTILAPFDALSGRRRSGRELSDIMVSSLSGEVAEKAWSDDEQ